MAYQRCTRCVMDNAIDQTITFDDQGHCNYCSDILKRMPSEYFPNGKKQLEKQINQIKEDCKNDEYDCIVGVSGGIDSSYILYLGHQYGLRMLAIHIDDGLDNSIAVDNLRKLIDVTGCKYIAVKPNHDEYADVLYSLFKASVDNLAIAQDNLIVKALQQYGEDHRIKYILDGNNFAHECILERSATGINFSDKKFILGVHKKFGRVPINDLDFMSLEDRYIKRHANNNFKHIRPLNYIDYKLDESISELKEFCDFEYYGGKHYESVLTRFMQCYYLPHKFGFDKRKSHYSSLIMTGQMAREEALNKLKEPLYKSYIMFEEDMSFLAKFMNISVDELKKMIDQPPVNNYEYPHSKLNNLAPIARKFRKILE